MAAWKPAPDEKIGTKEPIGRRLYDEPALSGARDQPTIKGLDLRNFRQVEGDPHFSVDRLGKTGIEKGVKAYLRIRAEWEGARRKPQRRFEGWVWRGAADLEKGEQGQAFPVIPSPKRRDVLDGTRGTEGAPESENIYHAHIDLDPALSSYLNALLIRETFTRGKVEKITSIEPERTHISWIREAWGRLRSLASKRPTN